MNLSNTRAESSEIQGGIPSSDCNPKSSLVKMSIESFVSPELQDSVLSKVSEWNPFLKLQSFQEVLINNHKSPSFYLWI